jgi:hypothetical protein
MKTKNEKKDNENTIIGMTPRATTHGELQNAFKPISMQIVRVPTRARIRLTIAYAFLSIRIHTPYYRLDPFTNNNHREIIIITTTIIIIIIIADYQYNM